MKKHDWLMLGAVIVGGYFLLRDQNTCGCEEKLIKDEFSEDSSGAQSSGGNGSTSSCTIDKINFTA